MVTCNSSLSLANVDIDLFLFVATMKLCNVIKESFVQGEMRGKNSNVNSKVFCCEQEISRNFLARLQHVTFKSLCL